MRYDRAALETISMELTQMYSRTILPTGLLNVQSEVHRMIDFTAQDLVLSLRALVMSDTGATVTETVSYVDYKFPRWLPKRLVKRWGAPKTVTLDATPRLVYPEQRLVSEIGKGRRTVEFYVHRDQ